MIPPDWKIVSNFIRYGDSYDQADTLIFKMKGEYWHTIILDDKFIDIMRMPTYMIENWFWDNRKPITESDIDWHIVRTEGDIKYHKKSLDMGIVQDILLVKEKLENIEERLKELRLVKRNIRISQII